jgi:pimeloyl-ACP methyl ester carboxylesterase
MAYVHVNGVNLFYEITGEGHPLVLVHGSWADGSISWLPVVQGLAESTQVVTFDRRGHSQSERPPGQGSRRQDEDDLAALIETLGLAPTNVAGNSFGASITLGLAARRPELLRAVIAHEPPLASLLAGDPELLPLLEEFQTKNEAVAGLLKRGEIEEGAKQFAEEIAIGPGSWELFPAEVQRTFIGNAPTYLDEVEDPAGADIDLQALSGYNGPALLTEGDQSLPWLRKIVEKLAEALPQAQRATYKGAGHLPQWTHPDDFIASLIQFLSRPSG